MTVERRANHGVAADFEYRRYEQQDDWRNAE